MAESAAETQVRLHLETRTAVVFERLWDRIPDGYCDLTLVCFDFGDGSKERFQNVAFKTSLPMPELVRTTEAMLERWRTGKPGPVEPGVQLPHPDWLRASGVLARSMLSEGVGHAIVLGRGTTSIYIANGDREGVAALFGDDLLPRWRNL